MSNINRLDGDKLGGLSRLYWLPAEQLLGLPLLQGSELRGNLSLAPGALWQTLEGTLYTPSLDSDTQDGPHGSSFAHELGGIFAGDSPLVAAQMQRMQGRRFVVLVRDFDKRLRLAGDQLGGLLFSYKYRTGKKPGERKGYEWFFKGQTPRPALFYTGSVPVASDTGGVITPEAPPTGGGGVVEVRSRSGRLLATVPAGRTLVLKSGFKLSFEII